MNRKALQKLYFNQNSREAERKNMAGKGTKNNQQNTQGEAQSEQAKQLQPLEFDVRIQSIKPSDSIKGTASVNINGAFAIRGVKIIEGTEPEQCGKAS